MKRTIGTMVLFVLLILTVFALTQLSAPQYNGASLTSTATTAAVRRGIN